MYTALAITTDTYDMFTIKCNINITTFDYSDIIVLVCFMYTHIMKVVMGLQCSLHFVDFLT